MADPGTAVAARRVLIPRPRGRGEDLARRLEARGAEVDLRPAIAFDDPADRGPRDRAVADVASFDWIVVTSPTGVSHLLDGVERAGVRWPAEGRLAAVGPGTSAALRERGRSPDVVARRADAVGLSADLVPRVAPGSRVLVVRPESGARDVLVDALRGVGAEVHAVAFYRTVASAEAAGIARDLIEGRYTVAVFTSPSTLLRILDAAGDRRHLVERALRGLAVVAIGPVTERALLDRGIPPAAVASSPTDEDVEAAVVAVW